MDAWNKRIVWKTNPRQVFGLGHGTLLGFRVYLDADTDHASWTITTHQGKISGVLQAPNRSKAITLGVRQIRAALAQVLNQGPPPLPNKP